LNFDLLVFEEVLLLSLYLFFLNLKRLRLGFVSLPVLPSAFASFPIVVEQLQKLDYAVVNKPSELRLELLLLPVVNLDFPKHCQKLIKAQMRFIRQNNSRKDFGVPLWEFILLSQELYGVVKRDQPALASIKVTKRCQEILKFAASEYFSKLDIIGSLHCLLNYYGINLVKLLT
jgi:hypothetical protein